MRKITVITSVLCPSLKTLETLTRCMQTVRNAVDRVNGEYIIIDDNSKVGATFFDKIADICVHNEKTLGLAKSLNKGVAISSGEFVVKLDADYFVPENLFEILLNDWSDDLCFITPSYIFSDCEDKESFNLTKMPAIEGGTYNRPPGLAHECLVPRSKYKWGGGILMFDKKKLLDVDCFDESFSIYGAEDNDVIYRLLLKGHNWRWDNNVVVRHFASISSRDKDSTQDWHDIRNMGVEYFKGKHGFEPGGFISKIYQKFNYKFEY